MEKGTYTFVTYQKHRRHARMVIIFIGIHCTVCSTDLAISFAYKDGPENLVGLVLGTSIKWPKILGTSMERPKILGTSMEQPKIFGSPAHECVPSYMHMMKSYQVCNYEQMSRWHTMYISVLFSRNADRDSGSLILLRLKPTYIASCGHSWSSLLGRSHEAT